MTRFFAVLLLLAGLAGCDRGATYHFDPENPVYPEFSGQRAYEHVKDLVEFGPRPAGSAALERTRVYLEENLEKFGWQTRRQTFTDETPNGPVEFVNLRARFGDSDPWDRKITVLIGSHYETKIYTDIRFVGANDSGSSTGALLEIARVAAEHPDFARQLELVFFDGEEAFENFSAIDGLYGSRHYAQTITRRQSESARPRYVVILDMIGEKDLTIRVPSDSPKPMVDDLMAASEELGYRRYFGIWRSPITDDHVPFRNEGIDAIDIIDFDFDAWHTERDTLDQISPESLKISGQTALLFIEKYLLGDS